MWLKIKGRRKNKTRSATATTKTTKGANPTLSFPVVAASCCFASSPSLPPPFLCDCSFVLLVPVCFAFISFHFILFSVFLSLQVFAFTCCLVIYLFVLFFSLFCPLFCLLVLSFLAAPGFLLLFTALPSFCLLLFSLVVAAALFSLRLCFFCGSLFPWRLPYSLRFPSLCGSIPLYGSLCSFVSRFAVPFLCSSLSRGAALFSCSLCVSLSLQLSFSRCGSLFLQLSFSRCRSLFLRPSFSLVPLRCCCRYGCSRGGAAASLPAVVDPCCPLRPAVVLRLLAGRRRPVAQSLAASAHPSTDAAALALPLGVVAALLLCGCPGRCGNGVLLCCCF